MALAKAPAPSTSTEERCSMGCTSHGPKGTNNRHESEWDHHGSYQWTYFSDQAKHRTKFFLSQRLSGKNLDLGGGWHLLYPNSTVVDLSSVCLSHNPATEKLHFDLDELGNGKKLPYADASFDSVTMVSVWQYLNAHEALVQEIQRVLKPGGKLYIINGQGAGLEGCVVASTKSEGVVKFFKERGFSTLTENIPFSSQDGDSLYPSSTFLSVCVSFPATPGKAKAETRHNNPAKFGKQYIEWEMKNRAELLSQLATYPVTKYSEEFVRNANELEKEFHQRTGLHALVFADHGILPQFHMETKRGERESSHTGFFPTIFVIGDGRRPEYGKYNSILDELQKKYGTRSSTHSNFFYESDTIEELMKSLEEMSRHPGYGLSNLDHNNHTLMACARFVTAIPLNNFTLELQEKIRAKLKGAKLHASFEDFDKFLEAAEGARVSGVMYEHKGKRTVENLIAIKRSLESGSEPLAGQAALDVQRYLPILRAQLAKEDKSYNPPRGDDDSI